MSTSKKSNRFVDEGPEFVKPLGKEELTEEDKKLITEIEEEKDEEEE